jgi:hypothetical protein
MSKNFVVRVIYRKRRYLVIDGDGIWSPMATGNFEPWPSVCFVEQHSLMDQ